MDFAKLIERAKGIVLSPKTEWEKIAAESTDVKSLYLGYAMILATIPAIASFVAYARLSVGIALGIAVVGYILGLVAIFVIGIIINALAPTFDGTSNTEQSLKLAVYSYTPAWLAGIFKVIPIAGGLIALVGVVYGIYVLYLGLSPLMKNPEEKSVGYTALVVVCAIILMFVAGLISTGLFVGGAMLGITGSIFR